jgi:peptidylprolyl isomerase
MPALPPTGRWLAALALVTTTAVGAAACREVTVPLEDPTSTAYAPALGVNIGASTPLTGGLYYQDVIVGSGASADSGKTVSVYYRGALSNGREFDSNRDGASPFVFRLGEGAVIRGWDEGLRGMRVGGRRRLVVPPALGYGARSLQFIPAGSVLVFDVDLVNVTG